MTMDNVVKKNALFTQLLLNMQLSICTIYLKKLLITDMKENI